MEASKQIREAMTRVAGLRLTLKDDPELALAVRTVKEIQAMRFAATYQDLLDSPVYAASANFFLLELYSPRDYSRRDEQFARIAGALERTFPETVVSTAVELATLHCLTEELDMELAQQWLKSQGDSSVARYCRAWGQVGKRAERDWQLATVLSIGTALKELTRKRGLRLMLKMMRRPAELAGLGSLQTFLEAGFDHFSGISRNGGSVSDFLAIVKTRETDWLDTLFRGNSNAFAHLDKM